MRKLLSVSFTMSLFLSANAVRADDQADIQALLDKAIKARGGDKAAKHKAIAMQFKGKYYGMGAGIDYTAEIASQKGQQRSQITAEAGGMKFTFISVINGDKGWRSMNGQTEEMDKEQLAEGKEELYASYVSTLEPLKGKGFKLEPLGESKVGKKAVVGIKVASKDHRDINLFFDKESGRLLKTERTVKDLDGGGQDVIQETINEEFKEVDGQPMPMKLTINRAGKLYVDAEITDIKFHEKLDDSVFGKP
jgi:hypothetical protein